MKERMVSDNIRVYYYLSESFSEKRINVHPDHYEISYCLDGVINYQVGQEVFEVNRYGLVFIPKGIEHSYWSNSVNETCSIMFTEFFIEKSFIEKYFNYNILVPGGLIRYDFSNNVFYRNSIERLLKQMIHERNDNPVSCLRIKNSIVELLLVLNEFSELSAKSQTKRGEIETVCEYMQKYFYLNIDLKSISEDHGISYGYMSKLFRKETSMTFKDYLNRIRLDKCAELLEKSDTPIMSICFENGFNDLAHFYRVFKNRFGKTPQQYRNEKSE